MMLISMEVDRKAKYLTKLRWFQYLSYGTINHTKKSQPTSIFVL